MDIILFFGLACFIFIFIYGLVKFKNSRTEYILASIIGFMIGCYTLLVFDNEPSSLDVYRGKTTLEITSVNGIPQDTVVVFKK